MRRPAAAAETYLASDEARMVQMINGTRADRGLPALRRLDGLVEVARAQSTRMISQQRLFHNLDLATDITRLGLDWSWTGENVGVGPNINAIEEAFIASVHHYENIVRSNYNGVGVGIVPDVDGQIYVTQVFAEVKGLTAQPRLPGPPSPDPTPPPSTPRPKPSPVATPIPLERERPPAPNSVEGSRIATTWRPPPTGFGHRAKPPANPSTVTLLMSLLARLNGVVPPLGG